MEAVCTFASRWTLSIELAERLQALQSAFPFSLKIFSGYRSPARQQELLDEGKSAAPIDVSTHTSCPATGADIEVEWGALDAPVIGSVKLPIPPGMKLGMNKHPTESMKRYFGRAAENAGLRWGGGAPRVNGVPVKTEWHHVDLGRRKT